MRTLTMSLTMVLCVSLALMTGCTVNTARDLVAKGSVEDGKNWGRTVLLCKVETPATNEREQEKIGAIAVLAGQALEGLPGVERVAEAGLLARITGRNPAGISDGELAAAALDAGADTVVLVQVLGYGGELTVSLLPPHWVVTLDYAYHARVIDARTGALYLDAQRGRRSSGTFAVSGRKALAERFKADLAAVLESVAQAGPAVHGQAKTGGAS